MRNLIIVSAGKFGREVYAWAKQMQGFGTDFQIKGFLDSRPDRLEGFGYAEPILGSVESYQPQPDDVFCIAIGNAAAKEELSNILLSKGASFMSVIHRSVVLGEHVRMGKGCVLCPNVVITSDVTLGDFVSINLFVSVGHDVVMGDFVHINPHVCISGGAQIGRASELHSNSTVLPDIKIGENCVVGAGAVVIRPVDNGLTVVGVPAKPLTKSS